MPDVLLRDLKKPLWFEWDEAGHAVNVWVHETFYEFLRKARISDDHDPKYYRIWFDGTPTRGFPGLEQERDDFYVLEKEAFKIVMDARWTRETTSKFHKLRVVEQEREEARIPFSTGGQDLPCGPDNPSGGGG